MKTFTSLILTLIVGIGALYAQCTIDQATVDTVDFGVYPTVEQGIPGAVINQTYSQNFTVVTIADTVLFGQQVNINSFDIALASGPAGLSIDCDLPGCTGYDGGDSACFVLSGTPSTLTTNDTIASVVVTLHTDVQPPLPSDIEVPFDYVLHVTVGIEENLDPNRFALSHNQPNPFSKHTDIVYMSPRPNEEVEFVVYNMLGKRIHREYLHSEQGINTIRFEEALQAGMYIYTISNGVDVFTKKMTVK